MPQMNEHFNGWIDRMLVDASGHKVGKIADIYTDDDTGQPEWLAVTTGLFGSNVSFVPVHGATSAGADVQVPFPKDQVKKAPNAGADGRLDPEEEARLYAHYGYDYDQERVRLQRWVDADRDDQSQPMPLDTHAQSEPMPLDTHAQRKGSWADDEEVYDLRHEPVRPRDRVEVGGDPYRR
jgi:hypothetical protein